MEPEPTYFKNLYRLPYSKNDNPNGWIEITTHCNLKCPGCYRGCHLDDSVRVHEPLEKIKEEIDQLVEIRNCQIISISGGEPLLHPNLVEIVSFISKKGLTPLLHTNGVLLTKDILLKLKKAGLISVHIRIDSLMKPEKSQTEKELNIKRESFSELFRTIGGLNLGFICVVNKANINELPDVIKWFRNDERNGDFLTLIPARDVIFSTDQYPDTSQWVTLNELHSVLKSNIEGFSFASYLGSQSQNKNYKWLQSAWVMKGNKALTFLSGKSIELFQMYNHMKKGKYSYLMNDGPNYISASQILFYSLFLKDFKIVLKKMILSVFKSPGNLLRKNRIQIISITMPPENINGKIDLCDACPDAILYKGELVPSCGLEEIKKYGNFIANR